MIVDKSLEFSQSQAVTATAASTNVIDLGVDRDIGNGEPIELIFHVDTSAASGTSVAKLTVQVQTDNDGAFGSPVVLQASQAFAVGDLVAGKELFKVKLASPTERYLRLNYSVSGENFTAGAYSAFLVLDRDNRRDYASGFSIA